MRGWNWGKGDFGKAELSFNVQNRPAFEIPYTEISNTNLAGKNEVSVEFSLPAGGAETGTNGHLGGARSKGRKAGAARDQLVEMRFYIPGTTITGTGNKKQKKGENGEGGEEKSGDEEDEDGGVEEQNAANLFYDTLMDKAEIGEVAGDTFATFLDILHLTPRFVIPRFFFKFDEVGLTRILEDDLTLTCTKNPSAYVAKPTITRFNTIPSRSSCFCPNQTNYTPLLSSV